MIIYIFARHQKWRMWLRADCWLRVCPDRSHHHSVGNDLIRCTLQPIGTFGGFFQGEASVLFLSDWWRTLEAHAYLDLPIPMPSFVCFGYPTRLVRMLAHNQFVMPSGCVVEQGVKKPA